MVSGKKVKINSLNGIGQHIIKESSGAEKSLNGLGEHITTSNPDSSENDSSNTADKNGVDGEKRN